MQNIYSRTEYINPNALYTLLSFHDITDHTFQMLKVFEDNKPVNKDSLTEAIELVAKSPKQKHCNQDRNLIYQLN